MAGKAKGRDAGDFFREARGKREAGRSLRRVLPHFTPFSMSTIYKIYNKTQRLWLLDDYGPKLATAENASVFLTHAEALATILWHLRFSLSVLPQGTWEVVEIEPSVVPARDCTQKKV